MMMFGGVAQRGVAAEAAQPVSHHAFHTVRGPAERDLLDAYRPPLTNDLTTCTLICTYQNK